MASCRAADWRATARAGWACRPGFFLSVRVLSRLFRRRFLEELQRLHDSGALSSSASTRRWPTPWPKTWAGAAAQCEWVVYASGHSPGRRAVLAYLSRARIAWPSQQPAARDGRARRHLPLEGLSNQGQDASQGDDAEPAGVHAPSCCTCCPAASTGSGTTGCWPTAIGATTWRGRASCCTRHRPTSPLTMRQPRQHQPSCARIAAMRWWCCRSSCATTRFGRHRHHERARSPPTNSTLHGVRWTTACTARTPPRCLAERLCCSAVARRMACAPVSAACARHRAHSIVCPRRPIAIATALDDHRGVRRGFRGLCNTCPDAAGRATICARGQMSRTRLNQLHALEAPGQRVLPNFFARGFVSGWCNSACGAFKL